MAQSARYVPCKREDLILIPRTYIKIIIIIVIITGCGGTPLWFQHPEGRGRCISGSSRPTWSTNQEQPGLHRESLSKRKIKHTNK